MTKDELKAQCDTEEDVITPKYNVVMTYKDEVVLAIDFANNTIATISESGEEGIGNYDMDMTESDWPMVRSFKEVA